jgi:hypothetical protein
MSEPVGVSIAHRVFAVLAALWVGSQLTVGYLVAPILFTTLEPAAAGQVASRLFGIEGWIGAVGGVVLMFLARRFARGGERVYRPLLALSGGMLLCAVIGLAMRPYMEAMRIQAMLGGTDVAHSAFAARFGAMHGVSTLIYVIASILGLVLLWLLPRRGNGPARA